MAKRKFKNEKFNDQVPKINKKFEAVTNVATSTTEIIVYGDIGDSWWGDSISASDIDRALKDVKTDNITVRINSPGGNAFDGITIYNRLKDHSAKVKVIVDGWACSAASIIAMSADELVMNTGSMLMIHQASIGIYGNKDELEKEAELLGKLDSNLVDIYMTKALVDRKEIEQMVKNETWFTAEEAIAIGFATSVEDAHEGTTNQDAEAFKNSVLARFKKEPQQPAASATTNNILANFKRNSNE
ncbi:head maturation protease, ClpP-related [Psychrobacillus sp. FSL K6-2365]|uniref:head maturation protease, ClpP-related n=1 Tax=Psychrobacillus sp. FSL K6-2365 TaxID=2921546 RepID=UPI0030F6D6C8